MGSFKIYRIWPQASNIHMHVRNAVPLVQCSLRLAPIRRQTHQLENVEHCGGEPELANQVWHWICHEEIDTLISLHQILHMSTARTATVSVPTYVWTKLYTEVTS